MQHLQHLNTLFSLDCAPQLIALRLYPNAKEYFEAMALWSHARRMFATELTHGQSGDCIICVGDGSRPRTGAIFALLAPYWKVYAIDPQMIIDPDEARWTYDEQWKVRNLIALRRKIQDVKIHAKRVIFVLMHAHVDLIDTLASVNQDAQVVGVIACPCCDYLEKQTFVWKQLPTETVDDLSILSPKNHVRIWKYPQPLKTIEAPSTGPSMSTLVNARKRASIKTLRKFVTMDIMDAFAHYLSKHFPNRSLYVYHLDDDTMARFREVVCKFPLLHIQQECNLMTNLIPTKCPDTFVYVDLFCVDLLIANVHKKHLFVMDLVSGMDIAALSLRHPPFIYHRVLEIHSIETISHSIAADSKAPSFKFARGTPIAAQAESIPIPRLPTPNISALITASRRLHDITFALAQSKDLNTPIFDGQTCTVCGVIAKPRAYGKKLHFASLWDISLVERPGVRISGLDIYIEVLAGELSHDRFDGVNDMTLKCGAMQLKFENQTFPEDCNSGDLVRVEGLPIYARNGAATISVKELTVLQKGVHARVLELDPCENYPYTGDIIRMVVAK